MIIMDLIVYFHLTNNIVMKGKWSVILTVLYMYTCVVANVCPLRYRRMFFILDVSVLFVMITDVSAGSTRTRQ